MNLEGRLSIRSFLSFLSAVIIIGCAPEYPPWVWKHPRYEGDLAVARFKQDAAACRDEVDWVETSPVFFWGLARDYNELKEREWRSCLHDRGWILEDKSPRKTSADE